MLDFDWLILGMAKLPALWGPEEKWVWLLLLPLVLNSKSGSRAVSVETTHEAGRHFFRVYGVLTRRFIFSPEALRQVLFVRETSSEEERRGKNIRKWMGVFIPFENQNHRYIVWVVTKPYCFRILYCFCRTLCHWIWAYLLYATSPLYSGAKLSSQTVKLIWVSLWHNCCRTLGDIVTTCRATSMSCLVWLNLKSPDTPSCLSDNGRQSFNVKHLLHWPLSILWGLVVSGHKV